jgi:hypothetical protein
MICPYCFDEGERSRVTLISSQKTLMAFSPTWDEDGKLTADPNTVKTTYQCSRGHHWVEKYRGGQFISRGRYSEPG